MKVRLWIALTASLLLWLMNAADAWRQLPNQPVWASGSNIVMHLQLGSSGTLTDGSASWNASAEGALAAWNRFLNGVSFRVERDSTAAIGLPNGINNVFWDEDVYGEPFGNAIAVAPYWYTLADKKIIEGDVIFDRTQQWNSYRGNLRSINGQWLYDLRRVALHEFGHTLGLDHPNEGGQSVTAIMNTPLGDVDDLQADDIDGARTLYGSSPNRSPAVTASCSPCTVDTGQATTLRATGSDPDGDSLSYQWTAPQGAFSNPNTDVTTWRAPNDPVSVTATITVQDGRGGRATATVALRVVRPDRLRSGSRLLPGQALASGNGRYRLLYQSDGNLVLYDDVDRTAPWASNTASAAPGHASMQGDGNFVIYDAQGVVRFATGTADNPNASLVVQNDGNLVIYRSDGQPVWDRFR